MGGLVFEIKLGLWLAMSPFIFGHYPSNLALWGNDLICAAAVIVLAILPCWSWPVGSFLRYAHLGILGVRGWLTIFGYVAGAHPATPGYQNDTLLGLTLFVVALIPKSSLLTTPVVTHYFAQRAAARRDES